MNAVKTPPPTGPSPAKAEADRPDPTGTPLDLGALVEGHQSTVWRYLRYLGAAANEADDLLQETFLAIARSGFRPRAPAATAAYLRRAAHNQLLMLRRKQRREPAVADVDAADAVWVERTTDPWDDQVAAVRECVEKLDGRARDAIQLHYRESAGREAIAERLGMTPDGVKTLLRRTRAALRECVERTLSALS